MLNVVQVGYDGKDSAGEDYHLRAGDEPLAKGYMVNIPTLIQYPDGKVAEGNQVKITPKGMEWLQRNVPIDIREPQGGAQ